MLYEGFTMTKDKDIDEQIHEADDQINEAEGEEVNNKFIK